MTLGSYGRITTLSMIIQFDREVIQMSNERIDIETIEARMRLWREGDISDEDLALELDYIVPELKRCYEREDVANEALLENAETMRKYVGQIIDMKRNIREMIAACEGVDSLFGEEVVGMLQELLSSE